MIKAEMLNEMNPRLRALLAAGLIGTAGLGATSCSTPNDDYEEPTVIEQPATPETPGSTTETPTETEDSGKEEIVTEAQKQLNTLLKIIDNPIQDIPLVTVMRSNIGKFTDDELIQIRLADKQDDFYTCLQKAKFSVDSTLKQKIESFLEELNQWRKEQEYLALDELIWKIYSDTGYYHYARINAEWAITTSQFKDVI